MANINVKFNNKDYLLSCDDGQENSLKKLTKFLDNKYTDEEIHNSIYKTPIQEINYQNHDFENAAKLVTDCLINKKKNSYFW